MATGRALDRFPCASSLAWLLAAGAGGNSGRIETVNSSDGPAYAPTWYTETMVAAPERAPLASDIDVDVCVIGAGLAGLTTARELARRGWSVVVLEARGSPGTPPAATPASCCRASPGHGRGGQAGRARPRQGAVGAVRSRARICARDDPRDRHARRRSGRGRLAQGLEDRRRRRGPRRRSGWSVRTSAPTSRAGRSSACATCSRATTISTRIHFPHAFHIHPLNYALGLAASPEAAGARIFEKTPALSIDADRRAQA